MPRRIQLQRTKGWRMPRGAVKVDRSTVHGNPWRVIHISGDGWYVRERHCQVPCTSRRVAQRYAVWKFRRWLQSSAFARRAVRLDLLVGKDLACWCPLHWPCHADVLLREAARLDEETPSP